MRLISKILLTTLVVASIYGFSEYRSFRKKLEASKTLVESAVPFEQSPARPSRRILVVGDSTGVGVGAGDPGRSLAGMLGAGYPDAAVTNRAVSGSKVRDIPSQLAMVRGQRFDLVQVQIGANDIVRFTDLGELELELKEMIDALEQAGGQVVVASCGNVGTAPIFPKGTRWLLRDRTLKVRGLFREKVRGKSLHYVDLFQEEDADPFARDPKTYYTADSFHPSAAGYGIWFRQIIAAISSLPGWERPMPPH